MYKVVIPSAGLGSRVGPYTKFMNKALLTIGGQPAITHIIDSFPIDVEIVIPVGYKSSYTKQVLNVFYNGTGRKITFVDVAKYEGPGSGLGLSLLCAKEHLQCPFVFVSNDTILPRDNIDLDPSEIGNWLRYHRTDKGSQYRTVTLSEDKRFVTAINPKGSLDKYGNSVDAYIGVCGIADWKTFWTKMQDEDAIEVGESYALKFLKRIQAFSTNVWCDTGNMESLAIARDFIRNPDHNILEKEAEAIWFTPTSVIKFSTDESFILDRVHRLKHLPEDMLPEMVAYLNNVYMYKLAPGKVLSRELTVPNVENLLDRMQKKVWTAERREPTERDKFICREFYETKTKKRIEEFHKKFEVADSEVVINGIIVPPITEVLDGFDWKYLYNSPIMAHFHGDFHNENILINRDGGFKLLDWRQNFGVGNLSHGDVYYDLAKYLHGLHVSHNLVAKGAFNVSSPEPDVVDIDINVTMQMKEAEEAFIGWLKEHKYDVKKVQILCALVFLNIAALHEYPYSLFLYYLGRHLLHRYS